MAKLGPKGSVGVSRKGNSKPRALHVSRARSGWSVESAGGGEGYGALGETRSSTKRRRKGAE